MRLEPTPSGGESPDGGLPPAGLSPFDELRQVYAAIDDDAEQTKVFEIEGTRTAVRYRRLLREESVKALASDGTVWEKNAQFLIVACDEIGFLRLDGKGQPAHGKLNEMLLDPLIPGERVTFDLRPGETTALHQALGADETDMRRSVLRVFQGVDDALIRHATQVSQWMGTVRDRTGQQFAGESPVTRP